MSKIIWATPFQVKQQSLIDDFTFDDPDVHKTCQEDHWMIQGIVSKGHLTILKHNWPLCIRSGFCTRCMAEICFSSTAHQPTFAILK